jgi:multidrug resistance efflux pump
MWVANTRRVITRPLPIPTENTTAMTFVGSRPFRRAAAIVMGFVVGSAAIAQQHLAVASAAAEPAPAVAVSTPRPRPSEPPPRDLPIAEPPAPVVAVSPAAPPREDATDILLSPTDGTIGSVFTSIGRRVIAGQALATIVGSESSAVLSRLAADVDSAREEMQGIEQRIAALDQAMTAALAARDVAVAEATQKTTSTVDEQLGSALARAQTIYNDAIARERRARALEAFGVPASQELEDAQVAVRAAAADVASLRRVIDEGRAAAAAEVEQVRAQGDARIADRQRQRDEAAAALREARLQQREAEIALASARERLGVAVRSRLNGTVAELTMQAGQRVTVGTPLVAIAPTAHP